MTVTVSTSSGAALELAHAKLAGGGVDGGEVGVALGGGRDYTHGYLLTRDSEQASFAG